VEKIVDGEKMMVTPSFVTGQRQLNQYYPVIHSKDKLMTAEVPKELQFNRVAPGNQYENQSSSSKNQKKATLADESGDLDDEMC
jgi:hypothetical protein